MYPSFTHKTRPAQMTNLPRLVENALDSLKSSFSLRSHLPSSSPNYLEKNRGHLEKFKKLSTALKKDSTPAVVGSQWTVDSLPKSLIKVSHLDFLGHLICVVVPESVKSVILKSVLAKKRELKFAITAISLAALFSLAILGHSLGFSRLANPKVVGVKEKLTRVLGTSAEISNELLLDQNIGFGKVRVEGPSKPQPHLPRK